jgi:ABC-type glycerol-3-phosphate transport system permease component
MPYQVSGRKAVYGESFTGAGYEGAWIQEEFWRAFTNTAIVCFFTVLTSLTIATLGGYALSRSGFRYSFWLLIIALVFRALPPITLVSGYLPPFYAWNVWGLLPTTIIVLVAINQPFTLWMLHSFFQTIPKELDESAKGRWLHTVSSISTCHYPCNVAWSHYSWTLFISFGL